MSDPTATLTLPETETTDATLALREEILRLKEQRRAVILAHNYQIPEIQDLADYGGDSLGLARQAAETDAETIRIHEDEYARETARLPRK